MSGKSQTIGDFTSFWPSQILPIYRICTRGLSQIFPIMNYLFVIGKLEPSNLGDWYWAKSIADGCRCPWRYKFEFSFVGNDRRPSQKSGTRRENRNAPDSPDLSPFIPDDRGYLRFRVFISRQNLGRSRNSKIPDLLGFSGHMKTRLKQCSGQRKRISKFHHGLLLIQTSHIFFLNQRLHETCNARYM